jgi:hypothetical protein
MPVEFIRDNLQMAINVIDAAWRNKVRKLLFLGSSCIYPKLAPQPLREESLRTLIITFVQSDGLTPDGYEACCGEKALSSNPLKPGFRGPGGGRVGALALSPFIRRGTVSSVPYNHYSQPRTVENIFGLGHLGYADAPALRALGSDVVSRR